MMNRTNLRFLTDVLLFTCLVGMAAIGGLMWFVIPEGPVSPDASKYFWGLHRHQWGGIHAYISAAFVVFLVLHLILSWGWIRARVKQLFRGAAVPAFVLLAALPFIVLGVFWLANPKYDPAYASLGARGGERARWTAVDETATAPRSETVLTDSRTSARPAGIAPIEPDEHESRVGTVTITGQTTLGEIAKSTGLSIEAICERAGLPRDLPAGTTLGRLRRLYGFQIQTLRDAVASLLKGS